MTNSRKPHWPNILVAFTVLVWFALVLTGGCSEPRIEADYEDHIAGCAAAYGDNDSQCIDNVNERFNR